MPSTNDIPDKDISYIIKIEEGKLPSRFLGKIPNKDGNFIIKVAEGKIVTMLNINYKRKPQLNERQIENAIAYNVYPFARPSYDLCKKLTFK